MMVLQSTALNCRGRRTLALGLLIAILLASFGPPTFIAQTSSSSIPENEHFILYQGPDGETICREATAAERLELEKVKPRNLRPINHLDGDKGTDPSAASHGGTHLKIILEGTEALNSPTGEAPLAKAAFIRAAAVWENLISSPVTIYIDADYGSTNFGEPWGANPPLGSTRQADSLVVNYPTVRNNLKNRADTAGELAIYNALPTDSVPTDIGTANSVVVSASVARAIGFLNPTAQSSDSRPRIAFNSSFQFDFDPSDGIVGTDFEAVATHEIGHALGFVSRNGISSTPPGVWDLYRFRTGITSDAFATAQRILTIGGPTPASQVYFVPGISPLAMSDGGPNRLKTNNADGNQSSHWKHEELNDGFYIGIMDPLLPPNTRREITERDIRAIDLFGYSLNTSTPPPPPANDNFGSAQAITGCSGSVNGTNINATSESNEPNHAPDDGGGTHSVWYQWQAPAGSNVTFTTAGSTFDTVLAVYTGTSVGSLSVVGQKSDDNSPTDKTSTVSFTPSAGTIYRIAVDGYNNFNAGGEFGSITLNWSVSNCIPGPIQPLQLLLAESASPPNLIGAVDSVLLVTDPFPVINSANLINPPSDRNTRVVVFVAGVSLVGQQASSLMVNLVDSSNQSQNIVAEDVRQVPGHDLTQVTFKLPTTGLATGTYNIKLIFAGQSSNTAIIRVQ